MTALFPEAGDSPADMREAIEHTVMELKSRGILTEMTPEEELAEIGNELSAKHGRDPTELIERYRRKAKEGGSRPIGRSAPPTASRISAAIAAASMPAVRRLRYPDGGRFPAPRSSAPRHRPACGGDVSRRHRGLRPSANTTSIFVGALRARHLVAEDLDQRLNPHAAYIGHAHPAPDRTARDDIGADPDRQSAGADRAAARACRTRRQGPPHPLPPDQCRARRTRRAHSPTSM